MDCGPGEARLKVFRIGPPLSLSHVLPILSTMGVEVVDERPYQLEGLPRRSYIYDFGLRHSKPIPPHARELFQDAVAAVWEGRNEADGFNALVLAAGLTWRQATVLRAYAKYMRQGGTPFAQDYIEDALKNNIDITQDARAALRDPVRPCGPRTRTPAPSGSAALRGKVVKALDDVVSLDHDRILRSYLTVIEATLRTNFYQPGEDGEPKPYISLEAGAGRDPRPARAPPALRDLRLLTAGRGRAPALRRRRPRRPAVERPS